MDFNFLWAWLAIGLAGLWIAVWQGYLIFNAIKLVWKDSKMSSLYLTVMVLWVALVESAAIYGLIVAMKILSTTFVDPLASVWVGLSVWLAWLWVWIGEWLLVWWALEAMNKSPENKNKILTYMILFLALVESSAIYGLVIAFKLLSDLDINWLLSIAIWLSIWLAWLWVWIWEWILSRKSLLRISDKPDMSSFYLTLSVLWIALVETSAIYWFIVSFSLFDLDVSWDVLRLIWSWLAIWFAWLWVWIGEWLLVSWAIDSVSLPRVNKTRILTYMILFIALVESAAIYGMLIAFQLFTSESIVWLVGIWAWLAVWLAWLWVWVWEWFLTWKSIYYIWKRPGLSMMFLTISILWVALVESAVIYGLLISFQVMSDLGIVWLAWLWAWLAVWLAWLWAGMWEWFMVWWTYDAISRNPSYKTRLLTFMILWVALVESAAIYWLVIAFKILL